MPLSPEPSGWCHAAVPVLPATTTESRSGPVSLVEASRDEAGKLRFRAKPLPELGRAMRLAYGEAGAEAIARHHKGLSRIAELLAAGEGTRARIHAVQLGFPDVDDDGMAKLARAVALRKINADWQAEPRLPPGQTDAGDWSRRS